MNIIKKITVFAESLSGNDEVVHKFKESIQEFDLNENLLAERAFMEDESLSFARTFKYNEDNVLLEKLEYMDFEQVAESTAYNYDEHGELIETVTMFMDGAKTVEKVARDGNVITILRVDENDIVEEREIKMLDEHQNIVEDITYEPNNEAMRQHQNKYNGVQRLIESVEYGYGEFVTHRRFEYDERGNIVRLSFHNDEGGLTDLISYQFDASNNLISEQHNDHHLIKSTYDNDGRLTKQETLNPVDGLTSNICEYVYDENGYLLMESIFDIGSYGGYDMHRSGGQRIRRIYEYDFFAK